MIKSIIWFACGGFYTACFSNAIRSYPILKRPSRHVLYTLIGIGIGYKFHLFEESAPERYRELMKKHQNAPWYERGVLLAEREARKKALEDGTDDSELSLADEFVDIEDDDD